MCVFACRGAGNAAATSPARGGGRLAASSPRSAIARLPSGASPSPCIPPPQAGSAKGGGIPRPAHSVSAEPGCGRRCGARGCLRTLRVRLRRIFPPLRSGAFPRIPLFPAMRNPSANAPCMAWSGYLPAPCNAASRRLAHPGAESALAPWSAPPIPPALFAECRRKRCRLHLSLCAMSEPCALVARVRLPCAERGAEAAARGGASADGGTRKTPRLRLRGAARREVFRPSAPLRRRGWIARLTADARAVAGGAPTQRLSKLSADRMCWAGNAAAVSRARCARSAGLRRTRIPMAIFRLSSGARTQQDGAYRMAGEVAAAFSAYGLANTHHAAHTTHTHHLTRASSPNTWHPQNTLPKITSPQ